MGDDLNVALEEFRVMHAQILERSRLQQHVISTGAVLGAAVLAALAAIVVPNTKQPPNYLFVSYFLLAFTFPFYVLSWAYAYQDYMIGATAKFIHDILIQDIRRLANNDVLIKNEFWFVHIRQKSRTLFLGWFSFHLILLFFPILLICTYLGLIIGQLYVPCSYHLLVQVILMVLNVGLIVMVSFYGRIGEASIQKAGKAYSSQITDITS